MKQLFSEYGKAIVSAVAVVIAIALLFAVSFYGESGILAGAGTVATVGGDMQEDTEAAGAVTAVNGEADTYTQTASWVSAGHSYALTDLYECSDTTAVVSICTATDEYGDDVLGSKVKYDRSTHKVTFTRGIYTMRVRFSGLRVGYADFTLTAL